MFAKLKSTLGFIYRGLLGIKDNFFDNPQINNKAESFSIGKTENGEDIDCYSFGEGEEKILYFGGIHGNEVGTVKLMNKWVNFLKNIDDNSDFGDKKVYVIPCLNIDGYNKAIKEPQYFSGGRCGKANSNDVDLNRNFPTTNWSMNSTLFAAGKYFEISGGNSPGSEPEIQALLGLIKRQNIQTVYTFHNCWGTVFGRGRDSVIKKCESYSQKSGYRIFTDIEFDFLELGQKTGQMMIWAEEQGTDVIEVEMRTRWGSEWNQNKNALIQSLEL